MAEGTIGGGKEGGGAVVDVRKGLCRRERVPVPVPLALALVLLLLLAWPAALGLLGADEGEAELDPGK